MQPQTALTLVPNSASQKQLVVTSAEFVRGFGHLRQAMGDSTVFVTHHGRATHALVTASRYDDLITAARQANSQEVVQRLPSLQEFAGWVSQGVLSIDLDMTIVVANRVAHAMVDYVDGDLIGRNIYDAIPALNGSLAQTYINRAAVGKEMCAAELPSIFRPGSWIRLEIYPLARNTTMLFRDITDDVHSHRLADTKKAIVDSMTLHGGIGYIRLSSRGQIDRIDPPMCRMLHFSEDRLQRIALADLVPVSHRVAFRETLDSVLRGDGAQRIETVMLANNGEGIEVCAAITELRGTYGNEGAVLVVTRN